MTPRTPAEALRWAAWETWRAGSFYARIGDRLASQDYYETTLVAQQKSDALDDTAQDISAEADRLDALPVAELSAEAKQAFTLKIQARSDASLFFRQHCVLTWDDVERALDAAGFAIVEVPRD